MTATIATPNLAAIKQRQQQTWSAGDYAAVGATLQIIAENLCEAVDLRAGEHVLDVATGSGNAAIAAARRFTTAVGIDYVPSLLDHARARAQAERFPIDFQDGDAENLQFPDASFDVVLSTLGVMFAPDHERSAQELLRVCRPGGRIGLANWTPSGFIGQVFRTIGRSVPPPAGLKSPILWGAEDHLRDLFGSDVTSLRVTRRSFVFHAFSPEHWLEFFRASYGPMQKAFGALDPVGQAELQSNLLALLAEFNVSGDSTLVAPSDYLEVVAVRR